jgi:hypothetical protein
MLKWPQPAVAPVSATTSRELAGPLLQEVRRLVQQRAARVRTHGGPFRKGSGGGIAGRLRVFHRGSRGARGLFAADRVVTGECRRVLRGDVAAADDELYLFHLRLRVSECSRARGCRPGPSTAGRYASE